MIIYIYCASVKPIALLYREKIEVPQALAFQHPAIGSLDPLIFQLALFLGVELNRGVQQKVGRSSESPIVSLHIIGLSEDPPKFFGLSGVMHTETLKLGGWNESC